MLAAIKSFFDSLVEIMRAYEVKIANQATTELVKEKRKLKKASDLTEQILNITDKYIDLFEETDFNKYIRLKAKFLKVN